MAVHVRFSVVMLICDVQVQRGQKLIFCFLELMLYQGSYFNGEKGNGPESAVI